MSKSEMSRLLSYPIESEADDIESRRHLRNEEYGSGDYFRDEDDFDGGTRRQYSDDDYEATLPRSHMGKTAKTGRQRRKQVARSKSTLPARRKRRVSVTRLPFDIKTDELFDNIESAQYREWRRSLYNGEVIRLFKQGVTSPSEIATNERKRSIAHDELLLSDEDDDALDEGIFDNGAKEVFIFDFGVAVFWGFPVGGTEEQTLIGTIRKFGVVKSGSSDNLSRTMRSSNDYLAKSNSYSDWLSFGAEGPPRSVVSSSPTVSAAGEGDDADDDMAFLLDHSLSRTKVKNDIIFLHKDSAKERLALSYGIAQSAVLAVFESRVDDTMESTKWIPETLAQTGKCHIKEGQLGRMIGAVFVIRHEVNLYSDILDTPDMFWNGLEV